MGSNSEGIVNISQVGKSLNKYIYIFNFKTIYGFLQGNLFSILKKIMAPNSLVNFPIFFQEGQKYIFRKIEHLKKKYTYFGSF